MCGKITPVEKCQKKGSVKWVIAVFPVTLDHAKVTHSSVKYNVLARILRWR